MIFINSSVFIYEFSFRGVLERIIRRFSVIPYDFINLFDPMQFISLFSSTFLHGNLLHLAGNMIYLWIFGNKIEDTLGHFKFIVFYLFCGVIASLTYILIQSRSAIPTIGASGAISGVLGAYLVLFSRARILTLTPSFQFLRVVKVPVIFFLGLWIFFQLLSGLGGAIIRDATAGKGIAWWGHIGGFFAGIILLPLFYRHTRTK
ncbi:MAG: rhomboid family intramembrane serine protease [Candidatus Omnitrophica bacterium]|nr:rhomboid family intramembrane serine protease [Candidatus Omnitrophota bacterium]